MDFRQPPVKRPIATPQAGDSLDAADNGQAVSFYASNPQAYSVETLDVHESAPQTQMVQPPRMRNGILMFSKRKAMVISTLITVLVVLLTGGSMLFLVRQSPNKANQSATGKQQDVSLKDTDSTTLPTELQGTNQSLLVNGDFITRGTIKVSNSGFVTVIKTENPTANQSFILPNASGTICLDSNNCSYVGTDQFTELQGQVTALSQVAIPAAGVTSLNNQKGDVAIQGSLNRINIATSGGVVTLSTPQDLDANANVQFGNLTVGAGGTIKANKLTQTSAGNSIDINAGSDMISFTAGGRVFQFPNSGALSQTICTSGASCAVGGGTAVLLSQPVAQSDATAEASIFINDTGGGHLIRLQSSGVDRLAVANNGDTTVSGSLTVSSLGNGFVKSASGTMSVVSAIDLSGVDVTNTLPVTKGGSGAATLTTNGVLVGNGASAFTSVAAGGAGLCLISTAGAPSWQACPGGAVTSVNGESGALTVVGTANQISVATGAGTLTLSTPQNIHVAATPTFAGLTLSGLGSGPLRASSGLLGTGNIDLSSEVSGLLGVASGGTGSGTAGGARTNLGAAASGANGDITSTTALNSITPSAALTVGATGQNLTLQGNASATFAAGNGANVTTLNFTAPSGTNTITFPALTGTVCVSTGNCAAAGTAGGDLTGSYPNPTIAKLQGTDLNITGAASGHVLIYNGTNGRWENHAILGDVTISETGTAAIASNAVTTGKIADGNVTNVKLQNSSITVTAGNGLSGGGAVSLGASTNLAVVYGSAANTAVQGNTAVTITAGTGLTGGSTITLGTGGSSTLNVAYGSTAGTAVQGNTSLTCASGTGNLSGGGNVVTLGAGGTCNNLTITNSPVFSGTLAVQGATVTVGANSQQGNVVLYDGGTGAASHTGTVQVIGSLGQNTTYILPDPAGATATICLSTGNCVGGGGGGAIGGGGTTDKLAKFTAAGTIGDSSISDVSGTVTATGSVIIQGSNSLTLGTSSSLDGSITFRTAAGANTVSLQAPASNPASNLTFKLPSSYGSNGDCLQSDGAGVLTLAACTGGAGGGVTSIDGLTGVVNISNATGSAGTITIDDATTLVKGIASFSGTNFAVTAGSVTIKAGGVTSTELATDAVTTTKIADNNVTNAKLQNSSVSVVAGAGLANGGSVALGSSTTLNIGAGSGITVNADDVAVDATVCRTSGNCAGVGGTGDILQNGNSFTAAMTIGTNDAFGLQLETSGLTRLTISSTGTATFTGAVNAASFAGDGIALTNLDASNLASGTVATGRISGSYAGITGVGTIATGTWQGSTIADAYLQDNITISSAGTVDWTALSNYPAACAAGNAITALGDTVTCSPFAAGGSGVTSLNGLTGTLNIADASGLGTTVTINNATTGSKGIASFNGAQFDVTTGAVSVKTGGITSTELATDAVTTSKIANSNVTNAKLQNSSVTVTAGSNLANGGAVSLGGTITLDVVSSPNFSGSLTVGTGATINGNSSIATVAGNTLSIGNTTGAIILTGSSASSFNLNGTSITAGEFNLLDGKDATLVDVNDAVNTAITGTGALSTGSISSGFGAIDVGADNITTSGTLAGGSLNVNGTQRIDSTGNLLNIGTYGGSGDMLIGGTTFITSGRVLQNVTYNGSSISDTYINDAITINSSGNVDWTALNNYPAACSVGQAITALGDTVTCTAFSSGVSAIGTLDSVAKSANGAVISGSNLILQTADASNPGLVSTTAQIFAGDKTFNGSVILAASQSLTITGGNTASRPGSPTEGMLYFDTATKQLLTYSNGKWQADRSTATKIIAPSNATQAAKDSADVVLTGTADQTLINTALTAAAGGKVYLMEGTISIAAAISIPNNTALAGAGAGTLITIPNAQNGSYNAITNTTTGGAGTGVTIQDLRLDGNKANQTSGTMNGIYLDGMGSGTGSSAIQGAKIINVRSNNWKGVTAGIFLASSSNNTVTGNTTQGNNYGISLFSSSNNTVTGNTTQGNTDKGIYLTTSSNSNTVTGNTTQGNFYGIYLQTSSNSNTVTGNTTQGNGFGIGLDSSNNTLTGNTVQGNTQRGIFLTTSSNTNTISGNNIYDNGGATDNNGIYLSASDSNSITGNIIGDTSATTTNYAINISNAASDTNYLADNTLGSGSINDAGTGTIYGGQVNVSGDYIIQPASTMIQLLSDVTITGDIIVNNQVIADSLSVATNQFSVSNAGVVTAGTWQGSTIGLAYGGTNNTTYTTNGVVYNNGSALVSTAAGTTGQCLLATTSSAPTWGACTPTTLQGSYDGSSPATINLTNSKDFTINATEQTTDSSIVFNLQCTTCSASGGRFAIQNAGTDVFVVKPNGDIVIGTSTNTMTINSTGYTLSGTARNSKTLRLPAEYAGGVLDTGATGSNLGTMISGYDQTNRMNYYKWSTTQATAQTYDVVVQVPIPKDFSAWDTNPLNIYAYTHHLTDGPITVQVIKSNGSADSNFATFQAATPGSIDTWANKVFTTLDGSNYTAGDYFTIRIRMQAKTGTATDTRIGNIQLNYLSSK